jgi:Recombination endonuclease VII
MTTLINLAQRQLRDSRGRLAVPCAICGTPTCGRFGVCLQTAACRAEHLQRWIAENPDRVQKKRDQVKRWQAANPEKRRTLGRRWYLANLRLPVEPGHLCPICGTDTPGGHGWHQDHDHRFPRNDRRGWREVLCHGCNVGLKLTDSIPLLLVKAEYLRRHAARIDALVAEERRSA